MIAIEPVVATLPTDNTEYRGTDLEHSDNPPGVDSFEPRNLPGALVLNGDVIVAIGESMRRLLGYELEEVVGRSVLDFVSDDSRIELREWIRQRSFGPFSYAFRCKTGELIYVVGTAFARVENGCELRDITVRNADRQTTESETVENLKVRIQILRQAVGQKEAALQELLNELQNQRRLVTAEIRRNIERVALPVVRRLQTLTDEDTRLLTKRLEETLDEIAAPFVGSLERRMTGLSPREIEICHMIKNGYSTKEIATVLAISPQTVSVHRKIIRRKLGLTGSDTNLISFLRTIESES